MIRSFSDGTCRSAQAETITVGILLFPDVEVLDFAGPFEVFSVAARIAPKLCGWKHPPFHIATIAADQLPVVARHGLRVLPDHSFANAPRVDVLIVPGGIVTEPLANPLTLHWLAEAATRAAVTASVCTGAFLLGRIGLLDGLTATTHWEDMAELQSAFPDITVVSDQSFVDQGSIVTSAGISAGIDMSLHLVRRLAGPELALLTARQMEYAWSPEETAK